MTARLVTVVSFFALWTALATRTLAAESATNAPVYYHLRQGVVFYVANPKGDAFNLTVELKDINAYCQGAQTALLKVYDPDGNVLFAEDLPDDGVTDGGYDQAWAGWDHELWARGALRETGAEPLFRWDTFSHPLKLEKIKGLTRTVTIEKPVKGTYQVQIAGCDDHFVKFQTSANLKFGVLGHPDFIAGRDDQYRTSYLYVPPLPYYCKTDPKLIVWLLEQQYPRTRRLTVFNGATPLPLTIEKGTNTVSATTLAAGQGLGRATTSLKDIKPGAILKLVNEGAGDFLIRVHGIPAIFCPDEETARFIAGGVSPLDNGPVVSFAFQKKLWDAVKNLKKEDFACTVKTGEWFKPAPEEEAKIALHAWSATRTVAAADAALVQAAQALQKTEPFSMAAFFEQYNVSYQELIPFYLYPFKGNALYHQPAVRNLITLGLIKDWLKYRGGEVIFEWGELNVAYAQGFHWEGWEPVWFMKEQLDPAVLAAFQEGARQIAERMYYANGLELVLSNGRTTVPLNLYHAYLITGDDKLKELSKRYFNRMFTALDGPHSGRSPSGYFREHFGADGGYCTYPLYQIGRLYQLSGDPDVLRAMDELCRWMCYVTLPDGALWTGPTSWQARINMAASEHIWGAGYKFVATKSEWAARLYRHFHAATNFYDVAEPVYEPNQPIPDKKTLLLTHLTSGVLKDQPLPARAPAPFFTDLGDGHEFFAVRRGGYYALLYAGKRPPFWMDIGLGGVNAFNGGGLAGLYLAGADAPVILGRCNKEYGWPLEEWEQLAVPVVVGTLSDGRVFNTGVSRNQVDAQPNAWTLRVTGEANSAPVNYERQYKFDDTAIAASVTLRNADLNNEVFMYRHYFRHSPLPWIKQAWEIVPCAAKVKATCLNASGQPMGDLTEAPLANVAALKLESGKGGVTLKLDQPRTVKRSKACPENTAAYGIYIQCAADLQADAQATLTYTLTPL